MKNNRTAGNRGLVKMIVLIIVALLILSYFGISLRHLASQPTTQDNFSFVTTTTIDFWNKYLAKPAGYLWHEIFLNIIWEPAINRLKHLDTVDLSTSTAPY
jgi:hypothetical protein